MIALVNKDRRAHPHKKAKNPKLEKFKKMKLVQPTYGDDKKDVLLRLSKFDNNYLETLSETQSNSLFKSS